MYTLFYWLEYDTRTPNHTPVKKSMHLQILRAASEESAFQPTNEPRKKTERTLGKSMWYHEHIQINF